MDNHSEQYSSCEKLQQFILALLPESSPVQQDDSGKALAALLIYLVAFVLTLFLFVRGFHSLAFVTLIVVWAVLAAWLQKGDR